jgi:hypothetical protein
MMTSIIATTARAITPSPPPTCAPKPTAATMERATVTIMRMMEIAVKIIHTNMYEGFCFLKTKNHLLGFVYNYLFIICLKRVESSDSMSKTNFNMYKMHHFFIGTVSYKPRYQRPVFLVRVHPDPCLILIRAQIRALLCASKSKFIPA